MAKTPDIAPCPYCSGECKTEEWFGRYRVVCRRAFCASSPYLYTEAEAIRAHNKVATGLDRGRVLRVLRAGLAEMLRELWPPEKYESVMNSCMDKIREMKP